MTRPDTITLRLSPADYDTALELLGIGWEHGRDTQHTDKPGGYGIWCRGVGYIVSRAQISPQ